MHDAMWRGLRSNPDIAAYDPWGDVSEEIAGVATATGSVTVDEDDSLATVEVMLEALSTLGTAPDPVRVQSAKVHVARNEVVRWLTTSDVLDAAVEYGGSRGELPDLDAFGGALADIGPDDIREVFAACPGHEVLLVRSPGTAALHNLRTAGYEVTEVDAIAEHRAVRDRKAEARPRSPVTR